MHDARPQTPPSKAVNLALRTLSAKPQTPRFNPELHKMPETNSKPKQEGEDSFVATIETRTPAKITQTGCLEESAKDNDVVSTVDVKQDDSFAENILLRSPIKFTTRSPISRIEDSVDAIDALEEEIEKIGESIPAIVDEPQSPVKNPRPRTKVTKSATTETKANKVPAIKKSSTAPTQVAKSTATKKATADMQRKDSTKASPLKANTTTPRRVVTPRSALGKPHPGTSTKPSLRSAGPATTKPSAQAPTSPSNNPTSMRPPPAKHPRVSSISKAPFVPKPSAKAPTRSTFTLPGEAISQKLKVQREERLKREEEENNKKREFKARPVPVSKAPEVKLTAATKARLSLAKGEALGEGAAIGQKYMDGYGSLRIPKNKVPPRIVSASSTVTTVNGRTNTKRPSILPEAPAVKANVSAPRAPSLGGLSSISQKSKGKEVFGRNRVEKEARDKDRREKEEAAKKARVEAAERGRIASREWAEKMKAKKASAAAATIAAPAAVAA